MKHYLDITAIDHVQSWIDQALQLKVDPFQFESLGKKRTLCMLFFNPSLRTRLSTQKAAMNLGMQVMVMNFGSEGWQLEFEDGSIMDAGKAEHIKEAAAVVSQYCDILAIRAFASLTDREQDEAELVLNSFKKYATVPIVNMESATAHPLQALADAITITEFKKVERPKVVLSWAPHPKALPHAVANSFVKMMQLQNVNLVITHPEGYELDPAITKDMSVEYDQQNAFKDADFVYVKNWSSYKNYGKVLSKDKNWMITQQKMQLTNNGKLMHCLPVRRNMVIEDAVLDSDNSIVIEQANNRTFAAQLVLKKLLGRYEN
ncbi:N-acetylornithine carbamoyltransferase [Sungkyunkwania multivorans]|uniref:N-succinylornithine carbamoyltransferase n=1 Tax=Sungkyunkwania multivorans TaxID=1173618 RepID=A0ABW3CW24_9FLAO